MGIWDKLIQKILDFHLNKNVCAVNEAVRNGKTMFNYVSLKKNEKSRGNHKNNGQEKAKRQESTANSNLEKRQFDYKNGFLADNLRVHSDCNQLTQLQNTEPPVKGLEPEIDVGGTGPIQMEGIKNSSAIIQCASGIFIYGQYQGFADLAPPVGVKGDKINYFQQFKAAVLSILSKVLYTDKDISKVQQALGDISNALNEAKNSSECKELSTIVFQMLQAAGLTLSNELIDNIKIQLKSFALTKNIRGLNTTIEKAPIGDDVTRYYQDLWGEQELNTQGINVSEFRASAQQTENLLLIDQVSTTQKSDLENPSQSQIDAKDILIKEKSNPPEVKGMTELLLKLNVIYSKGEKRPYIRGFRYNNEQIGQGESAIGTTQPIAVEGTIVQVMNAILKRLEPCEQELSSGRGISEENIKIVILTAAMAYQMLISIHPFNNGNGRTCRMFANYILMRYGLLPALFNVEQSNLSVYDGNKNLDKAKQSMLGALENSKRYFMK